jgi:hypothetical protein
MKIEGTIISSKNGLVNIRQSYTGDVYRCKKSDIQLYGKNGIPEKINGRYFAKVDAMKASLVHFGGTFECKAQKN